MWLLRIPGCTEVGIQNTCGTWYGSKHGGIAGLLRNAEVVERRRLAAAATGASSDNAAASGSGAPGSATAAAADAPTAAAADEPAADADAQAAAAADAPAADAARGPSTSAPCADGGHAAASGGSPDEVEGQSSRGASQDASDAPGAVHAPGGVRAPKPLTLRNLEEVRARADLEFQVNYAAAVRAPCARAALEAAHACVDRRLWATRTRVRSRRWSARSYAAMNRRCKRRPA